MFEGLTSDRFAVIDGRVAHSNVAPFDVRVGILNFPLSAAYFFGRDSGGTMPATR
jgi:hypothetical protein